MSIFFLPPPMSEKLERSRARNRLRMTRFPTRTVAMKYGMQALPLTKMQSHIDSIHSPQRTRNTIIKLTKRIFVSKMYFWIIGMLEYLCMKSVKFHLGIAQPSQ